jgi:hypothetical protein
MSFWEPFNLIQLPLSAYTPGQGDRSMEGGWETATGAPVYTFEQWQRGEAPYVTGATSQKNPSGALVYRSIGEHTVPVRITDYGPGVKGIDIASSNKRWATNFPYQGATDAGVLAGNSGVPDTSGDGLGVGQFNQQTLAAGLASGHDLADYASALSPSTTSRVTSSVASALGTLGKGLQQQGQRGMQQALGQLQQTSPGARLLQQLAANPLQYLQNPYIQGVT